MDRQESRSDYRKDDSPRGGTAQTDEVEKTHNDRRENGKQRETEKSESDFRGRDKA
ncbi:MAG: hypothetical protein LBM17_00465 [Candidatus Accumulibacter sp.]|nr:hypothetical protein [Accumulibacter sp.]